MDPQVTTGRDDRRRKEQDARQASVWPTRSRVVSGSRGDVTGGIEPELQLTDGGVLDLLCVLDVCTLRGE